MTQRRRILIFGGHGKVALLLTPLLTQRGHEVTSVIRSETQSEDVLAAGGSPVVADVETMSTEQIADLVTGQDAIVWSAGAGGGSPERTYALDRDAAIRSMEAAVTAGVRRYLMVSYLGSSLDHAVPRDHPFFAYAQAKAEADEHLRGTDLDWTVLGPGTLTTETGTGSIRVIAQEDAAGTDGTVTRADVAAVVVEALDEDATIHRTIRFGAGPTPIVAALTGDA